MSASSLSAITFPATGDTLWACQNDDTSVYVAIRPICVTLGLSWGSQYNRIMRNAVLSEGVFIMNTPSTGGEQNTLCLPLPLLPGWLFGIDVGRVKEALRRKLIAYQRECFAVLWRHFNGNASYGRTINPPVTAEYPQPAPFAPRALSKWERQWVNQQANGIAQELAAMIRLALVNALHDAAVSGYGLTPSLEIEKARAFAGIETALRALGPSSRSQASLGGLIP